MNKHTFKPSIALNVLINLGVEAIHPDFKAVDNMLRTTLIILFALTGLFQSALGNGDPKRVSRSEYISLWKDEAILQMREHGIPASITLAQAILESGDGNSELARKGNNHFGIKCHDWTGKKVYHDDDKRHECFRKYDTAHQSFEDHSLFLKRSRYAFLYDYKVTDYEAWAKGLKKAGYATNPKYPDLLIRIIEENNLTQYDKQGLSKNYNPSKPNKPASKTTKEGDAIVITIDRGKNIFVSDNKIKYIVTESATTPAQLAEEMDMGKWQISRYNDLDKRSKIDEGTRIYIQPKRNKSKQHSSHTVATGETLHTISQHYGVKEKKILKFSDLPKGHKVKPGEVLKLRR